MTTAQNPLLTRLHANLSTAELSEAILKRKAARQTKDGAILFYTGKYTGRAPQAKFIVDDERIHAKIGWGKVNQPLNPAAFHEIKNKVLRYLMTRDVFTQDCYVGADKRYRLPVTVLTENPVYSLFSRLMFLPDPYPGAEKEHSKFTILHVPELRLGPEEGTGTDAFILLNFPERIVLIGGTGYAGEVKKSVFTIMNYLMPERGVLPMHCSANFGAEEKDAAIFFGLSGTGKTTLSTSSDRTLVGDDEHGWSPDGIFNFEGGCYAKVIKLSEKNEPDIFHAIHRPGALLENVASDEQMNLDLDSAAITENTRAAYPISFIPHMSPKGSCGHPKNILMLTCDAFGVLPPVAKLTRDQALYHFLSGYTAKVAGTETGIQEPEATFSPCFGGPFMPRPPIEYARLLGRRIDEHQPDLWLVNTGWIGGPYGIGNRIRLDLTRQIVQAILSGRLKTTASSIDPIFKFRIPKDSPQIPKKILEPRNNWKDKAEYDQRAKRLAGMFHQNLLKLNLALDPSILSAGPQV